MPSWTRAPSSAAHSCALKQPDAESARQTLKTPATGRQIRRMGLLLLLELLDDLLDLGFRDLEPELAGAGAEVAASAIGRAEVARAHLAAAVEDRMADRDVAGLAALAAEDSDLDVALRIERVDQEAIPRRR